MLLDFNGWNSLNENHSFNVEITDANGIISRGDDIGKLYMFNILKSDVWTNYLGLNKDNIKFRNLSLLYAAQVFKMIEPVDLVKGELENMPIFYYRRHKLMNAFTNQFPTWKIYNRNITSTLTVDKIQFYRTFSKYGFVPNTVYRIQDVSKIGFPLIAKKRAGSLAKGVMRYDDMETLLSDHKKYNFDLFQKAIKVVKEFRIYTWNNNIIDVHEKVAGSDKMKYIRGESDIRKDTKVEDMRDNVAIHLGIAEFLTNINRQKLNNIISTMNSHVQLDFQGIDLVVDDKNQLYILETNNSPGSTGIVFLTLYEHMFKDYYKRPLCPTSQKWLNALKREITLNMLSHSTTFNVSNEFLKQNNII